MSGSITPLTVIGTAKEDTFGTFKAPTNYIPGSCTPNTQQKLVRPTQQRGDRAPVIDVRVGHEAGCQITAELIPEVVSLPLAGWFGTGGDNVSGNAGVGYTHALTPQNAVPSFSVEWDDDIASQLLARQLVGNVVDQVVLKAAMQSLATIEFQMLGQRETTPATPGQPSNASPTISTLQPIDFHLLAATLDGGAKTNLQDVTLTLQNKAQRVFTNNGQLYCSRIAPTSRNVTLSTTLDFLDLQFYSRWAAGSKSTTGGLVLTFTTEQNITGASQPWVVQFTVPGIRPDAQYNLGNASEVINEAVTWSVTKQGANEISASLRNSEAGQYV